MMRPRNAEVAPGLAWWQSNADLMLREIFKNVMQLDVKTSDLTGRKEKAVEAIAAIDQVTLPFLLRTDGGQAALFTIEGTMIDGLIEQQLLGKVMPTPRLDRPITAIDAGLSEGFVRAVLNAMSEATGHLSGLTTRGPEQDRPTLELALGMGEFDIISATVDMGPGIKTGRFEIWTPAAKKAAAGKSGGGMNPALMDSLQHCKIELETEMSGCEITAKTLMHLQVGSMLPLPASALGEVALKDCNGKLVGRGRLGQLNGQRALRITEMEARGKKPAAPPSVFNDLTIKAATAPAAMTDLTSDGGLPDPMAAAPMSADVMASDPMAAEPMAPMGQGLDQPMASPMGEDLPAMDMPAMDMAPMQPMGQALGGDEDEPMQPLGIDPAQAVG